MELHPSSGGRVFLSDLDNKVAIAVLCCVPAAPFFSGSKLKGPFFCPLVSQHEDVSQLVGEQEKTQNLHKFLGSLRSPKLLSVMSPRALTPHTGVRPLPSSPSPNPSQVLAPPCFMSVQQLLPINQIGRLRCPQRLPCRLPGEQNN